MTTKFPLLILSMTVAALGMMAADPATRPNSSYQQAVEDYVEAAGKELDALRLQRDQLMKSAPEGKKDRFAEFSAKVAACEEVFAELKKASSREFDFVKARYEESRGEAAQALAKAVR